MNERTPQDYAIEHAEYMAKAAERYIEAVEELQMAQFDMDDVDDDSLDDAEVAEQNARESVTEHRRALSEAIYEFRKRRDRAAQPAQPKEGS